MQLNQAGAAKPAARTEKAPKPPSAMPSKLAQALERAPHAKTLFEAFAPSDKREYIEWIADAKRDEMREKCIAQAIEWLSEGKRRNWKYENC